MFSKTEDLNSIIGYFRCVSIIEGLDSFKIVNIYEILRVKEDTLPVPWQLVYLLKCKYTPLLLSLLLQV